MMRAGNPGTRVPHSAPARFRADAAGFLTGAARFCAAVVRFLAGAPGSPAAAALVVLFASGRAGLAAENADPEDPPTYPLVLLVQADAVLASAPAASQDPDTPTAGTALRLRRVRVGEDVRRGAFRLRAVFEAQPSDAAGDSYSPLAGGRLPAGGGLRAADLVLSLAPSGAFHLDAGSMRVPFSLSRQVDEADLRMLERPAFVDAFLPDTRTGMAIGGDLGELLYRAAVMSADQTLDGHLFGRGWLVAGRLTAEPLGPLGLAPWRLSSTDPWYDWFRFAAGLSVLYGTVTEPRTLALDPDFQAQWRCLVVTVEYLFSVRYRQGVTVDPSSYQQGAAIEPGVTLLARRLDLVARGDWERAGAANSWGGGAGLTAYAPDPRLRFGVGFEWRHGPAAGDGPRGGIDENAYWAIARITIAVN